MPTLGTKRTFVVPPQHMSLFSLGVKRNKIDTPTVNETAITISSTNSPAGAIQQTASAASDWEYVPRFIDDRNSEWFDKLHKELYTKLLENAQSPSNTRYRISCKLLTMEQKEQVEASTQNVSKRFSYSEIPTFDWSLSETVGVLRAMLEARLKCKFRYVLVHLYLCGLASIAFHFDKEALDPDTAVVSLSFGASRLFEFAPIKTKKTKHKFTLNSGDLLVMKPGCQRRWEHRVPAQSKIQTMRYNLTFR